MRTCCDSAYVVISKKFIEGIRAVRFNLGSTYEVFMLRRMNETYRSHRIAAAPGTHQVIANLVNANVGKLQSILELGAYTGALLERIGDRGYKSVTAADLDNHLAITSCEHIICDFNCEFSKEFSGKKFDCIIACEVIEHLNDVRFFLNQCHALLNDNGVIIVTTPNIGFFEGRIKFLLTGELWGFGKKNYKCQRHISPISMEQFPLLMQETGYSVIQLFTAGSFATHLRMILTSIIWLPMRMIFGRFVLGETTVCLAKKSMNCDVKFKSSDLWKKKSFAVNGVF